MTPGSFPDYSIFLAYFILSVIYLLYRRSKISDLGEKQLFIYAGLFHVLMGFILCNIYIYEVTKGDSLGYFKYGTIVNQLLLEDPYNFTKLIIEGDHAYYSGLSHPLANNEAFVFMKNLIGVLSFFTFNSYLSTCILFSLYSFSGLWYLYKQLLRLYPSAKEYLGLFIFFLPSVTLWTSGVLKDSIILGSLAYGIGILINMSYFKEKRLWSMIVLAFHVFLIYKVKSYVGQVFILSIAFFFILRVLYKIKNRFLRYGMTVLSFGLIAVLALLNMSTINQAFQEHFVNSFLKNSLAYNDYLNYIGGKENPSSYTLGININNFHKASMSDILALIPEGIVTTLYRPFLWEASKPIMLLTAIENTLVILFTLYIILKTGVWTFIKTIYKDPFLMFLLFFVLVFSFALGVATGNFGALSRYRTPGMALYMTLLYLVYNTAKQHVIQRKEKSSMALPHLHSPKLST